MQAIEPALTDRVPFTSVLRCTMLGDSRHTDRVGQDESRHVGQAPTRPTAINIDQRYQAPAAFSHPRSHQNLVGCITGLLHARNRLDELTSFYDSHDTPRAWPTSSERKPKERTNKQTYKRTNIPRRVQYSSIDSTCNSCSCTDALT